MATCGPDHRCFAGVTPRLVLEALLGKFQCSGRGGNLDEDAGANPPAPRVERPIRQNRRMPPVQRFQSRRTTPKRPDLHPAKKWQQHSVSVGFREVSPTHWRLDRSAPLLNGEDPASATIHGQTVISVVELDHWQWAYRTVFYAGADVQSLKKVGQSRDMMKGVRLIEYEDGRIGVFTLASTRGDGLHRNRQPLPAHPAVDRRRPGLGATSNPRQLGAERSLFAWWGPCRSAWACRGASMLLLAWPLLSIHGRGVGVRPSPAFPSSRSLCWDHPAHRKQFPHWGIFLGGYSSTCSTPVSSIPLAIGWTLTAAFGDVQMGGDPRPLPVSGSSNSSPTGGALYGPCSPPLGCESKAGHSWTGLFRAKP